MLCVFLLCIYIHTYARVHKHTRKNKREADLELENNRVFGPNSDLQSVSVSHSHSLYRLNIPQQQHVALLETGEERGGDRGDRERARKREGKRVGGRENGEIGERER